MENKNENIEDVEDMEKYEDDKQHGDCSGRSRCYSGRHRGRREYYKTRPATHEATKRTYRHTKRNI